MCLSFFSESLRTQSPIVPILASTCQRDPSLQKIQRQVLLSWGQSSTFPVGVSSDPQSVNLDSNHIIHASLFLRHDPAPRHLHRSPESPLRLNSYLPEFSSANIDPAKQSPRQRKEGPGKREEKTKPTPLLILLILGACGHPHKSQKVA